MRVVTLMFDTLRRDILPQYGGGLDLPNFKRLEEKTITFDNFYAGSLPCMPARREMLTGHPNFLHRGWSPLEPFDVAFTEVLKKQGIYSHLVTDHQHYWEDGGATYHNRYNSYEFVRGQEGDLYKGHVNPPTDILKNKKIFDINDPQRNNMYVHDEINRMYMKEEADFPQSQCVELGLEFLEKNKEAENWYLQVECFDPHEPFFVPDRFKDMVDLDLKNETHDWPGYESTRSMDNPLNIEIGSKKYQALLYMIDESLGKFLDFFDENNMWENTALILNTDHGFIFGEKEWSGKSCMPVYEELAHTPFAIHIPDSELNGTHVDVIAQTYDIAQTMYSLFEVEDAPETFGRSLVELAMADDRKYGYTGYFAGHVNIFDKRYTYMRGAVRPDNMPLKEYTLMPMRMRRIFNKDEFNNATLTNGFSYFKDWKVLEVDSKEMFYSPFASGNLLFDRKEDPKQLQPIDDVQLEAVYVNALKTFFSVVDAPQSQYERLGLDGETDIEKERATRREIIKGLNQGIDPSLIDRDMQATIINLELINKKDILINALSDGVSNTKQFKEYVKEQYPTDIELLFAIQ